MTGPLIFFRSLRDRSEKLSLAWWKKIEFDTLEQPPWSIEWFLAKLVYCRQEKNARRHCSVLGIELQRDYCWIAIMRKHLVDAVSTTLHARLIIRDVDNYVVRPPVNHLLYRSVRVLHTLVRTWQMIWLTKIGVKIIKL